MRLAKYKILTEISFQIYKLLKLEKTGLLQLKEFVYPV